jgi:hypothetical protein
MVVPPSAVGCSYSRKVAPTAGKVVSRAERLLPKLMQDKCESPRNPRGFATNPLWWSVLGLIKLEGDKSVI